MNKIIVTTHSIIQLLRRTLLVQKQILEVQEKKLREQEMAIFENDKEIDYSDDWLVEAYVNHEKTSRKEAIDKEREALSIMETDLYTRTRQMEEYESMIFEEGSKEMLDKEK
jgi:hypothetical protein